MSPFEKIYAVVSRIPKGKVLTYQQVARVCSIKNPRVVGFAMHANKNPQAVPCHRVVGVNGELRGYARGGVTKKKEILKREGVFFLDNNCVDLKRSLFQPL